MSPTDPLPPLAIPSPISSSSTATTSPIDISPFPAVVAEADLIDATLSPRFATISAKTAASSATVPPTPILSAVVGKLPRLVTSFRYSGGRSNSKHISSEIQFTLLTPSPLTLRSSMFSSSSANSDEPNTAVLVMESGRSFGIKLQSQPSRRSPLMAVAGIRSCLVSTGADRRRVLDDESSREHVERVPKLYRQNAMEGIADMEVDRNCNETIPASPSERTVIELPIRSNVDQTTSSSISSRVSEATTVRIPRRHSRSPATSTATIPPSSKSRASKSTSTSTSGSRSRSQVRKRQHQTGPIHRPSSIPNLTIRTKPRKQTQAHLQALLTHLAHPLVALVSVTTGTPHPDFPRTLLSYHLLTHEQLDSLARHYHQTIDAGDERWLYPAPIGWGKVWCGSQQSTEARNAKRHLVDLDTKRRRWGKFIGLKGCESPVDGGEEDDGQTEDIAERMEREWRDALRRAEEEKFVKEKIWGRRF